LTDLVPALKTDPPIEYHTSRAALLAAQNTTFFDKIYGRFWCPDTFNMRYIVHTCSTYSDKMESVTCHLKKQRKIPVDQYGLLSARYTVSTGITT